MKAPGECTRPATPRLPIHERGLGSWWRLCKVGLPDGDFVMVPRRIPPRRAPQGIRGANEGSGRAGRPTCPLFSRGFPALNANVTFHQKALVAPTYGGSVASCPQGIGLPAQPDRKESTRQQRVFKDIEDDAIRMLTPLVKYRRASQCCRTLHVLPETAASSPAADVTGSPSSLRPFRFLDRLFLFQVPPPTLTISKPALP